jgi:hypothetical protein
MAQNTFDNVDSVYFTAPFVGLSDILARTDFLILPKRDSPEAASQSGGTAPQGPVQETGRVVLAEADAFISVQFSAGFNPLPKLDFASPVSIGVFAKERSPHWIRTGSLMLILSRNALTPNYRRDSMGLCV